MANRIADYKWQSDTPSDEPVEWGDDCVGSEDVSFPESNTYASEEVVAELIKVKLLAMQHEATLEQHEEKINLLLEKDSTPNCFEAHAAIEKAKEFTEEIFGDGVVFATEDDAEVAGQQRFEFQVTWRGEIDIALAKHDEWHAKLVTLPYNLRCLFHLSIDPA